MDSIKRLLFCLRSWLLRTSEIALELGNVLKLCCLGSCFFTSEICRRIVVSKFDIV
jgi:hypothetical protein